MRIHSHTQRKPWGGWVRKIVLRAILALVLAFAAYEAAGAHVQYVCHTGSTFSITNAFPPQWVTITHTWTNRPFMEHYHDHGGFGSPADHWQISYCP